MRSPFNRKHLLIIGGLAALLPLVFATVVAARDAFRAGPGTVAWLAADAEGAQSSLLSDGFVSAAEYESAVAATVACLRGAGIAVTEPQWKGQGLRFTYGGYSSRAELETADEFYADCYASNQAAIDRVWARQQTGDRPDAEAVAAYNELMRECTGAAAPTFRAIVSAAEGSGDASLLERCHLASAEAAEIPTR